MAVPQKESWHDDKSEKKPSHGGLPFLAGRISWDRKNLHFTKRKPALCYISCHEGLSYEQVSHPRKTPFLSSLLNHREHSSVQSIWVTGAPQQHKGLLCICVCWAGSSPQSAGIYESDQPETKMVVHLIRFILLVSLSSWAELWKISRTNTVGSCMCWDASSTSVMIWRNWTELSGVWGGA